YNLARRRQYQYDARRQQGDGGGVFGDSQFTSTLSVNFHFPKIPRRTKKNPPQAAPRVDSSHLGGKGKTAENGEERGQPSQTGDNGCQPR
ncbi:hypothetical protein, partial [Aeromonas sp. LsrichE-8G]|uniref:hypothetical protein n=1 Tax=Aeromonas sp. LsrichE-8G TaxID=2932048 RepID=UPI001FD12063